VSDATAELPPEVAAAQLMYQLGTGYMLSSALQVVLKLGIADRLAGGPVTTAALAQATGVKEDALYRLLRALASVGAFKETAAREFALTLPGELLRADHPHSVRPMLLWISSPFHFRVYSNMMHAVRTGKPAVAETVGVPVFEYFTRDHDLSEIFNDAMTNFSTVIAPAVLASYDFAGVNVLVGTARR